MTAKEQTPEQPDQRSFVASNNAYSKQAYVQWVVKVSKLCNLRCTYCYEFPFLGEPSRIEPSQLERMFRHIADFYRDGYERMDFVWHGGEPLLLSSDYYKAIYDLQNDILGNANVQFTNSVQTNLVRVKDDILDLFGTFFTNIGVSIDLFGDQRVNVNGKCVERQVLDNMQMLKDRGVIFGCITVLSKLTAPHVEKIYEFFENISAGFRLLPIYRTGYEGQQVELALTNGEIVDAFKKVVDHWLRTDSNLTVLPIQDYVNAVVAQLSGTNHVSRCYNKINREIVYIVDTDGGLFSNADAYDTDLRHGNIFDESLQSMHSSTNYLRAVSAAHARMNATCNSCRYFGSCSGYFMAEATPEQRWADENGHLICGVAQPIQRYIEQTLINNGFVDAQTGLMVHDKILAKLKSTSNTW